MLRHSSTTSASALSPPPFDLLGISWGSPGELLGSCWGSPGELLGSCWGAAGELLGSCCARARVSSYTLHV